MHLNLTKPDSRWWAQLVGPAVLRGNGVFQLRLDTTIRLQYRTVTPDGLWYGFAGAILGFGFGIMYCRKVKK